jgi:ribosome-binding factor A
METQRQQKYSRLVQKELAEIFLRDTKSLFEGAWVTVTTVRMSPDLSVAKVYLSFLMVNDMPAMLEKIKAQAKAVRKLLGGRIGKQVRIIPEVIFYLDDNADYAAKMDDIFNKIDIPPAPPEDEK